MAKKTTTTPQPEPRLLIRLLKPVGKHDIDEHPIALESQLKDAKLVRNVDYKLLGTYRTDCKVTFDPTPAPTRKDK